MSKSQSLMVGLIIVLVIGCAVVLPVLSTMFKRVDAEATAISNAQVMATLSKFDGGTVSATVAEEEATFEMIEAWCLTHEAQGEMVAICEGL